MPRVGGKSINVREEIEWSIKTASSYFLPPLLPRSSTTASGLITSSKRRASTRYANYKSAKRDKLNSESSMNGNGKHGRPRKEKTTGIDIHITETCRESD